MNSILYDKSDKGNHDLDDQVIFWRTLHLVHNNKNNGVAINPIGECKAQAKENSSENVFTLCGLDNCLFSAGMITNNSSYGKSCCSLCSRCFNNK